LLCFALLCIALHCCALLGFALRGNLGYITVLWQVLRASEDGRVLGDPEEGRVLGFWGSGGTARAGSHCPVL
jgi:hypothetical protein